MDNSIFVIFIGFGCLWILMAAVAWIAFLKSEGEEIRFSKWGLIVTLPIIIPIIVTLIFGAVHH
jgi:hypothetical protein